METIEFACPNRAYKVTGAMEFVAKVKTCSACGIQGHNRQSCKIEERASKLYHKLTPTDRLRLLEVLAMVHSFNAYEYACISWSNLWLETKKYGVSYSVPARIRKLFINMVQ